MVNVVVSMCLDGFYQGAGLICEYSVQACLGRIVERVAALDLVFRAYSLEYLRSPA